jgi:hypothetical protein
VHHFHAEAGFEQTNTYARTLQKAPLFLTKKADTKNV